MNQLEYSFPNNKKMKLKVGEIMREPKSLENSNKHPINLKKIFTNLFYLYIFFVLYSCITMYVCDIYLV